MCALRQCVSCGDRTWVLDSDGTCPDCGGRSRPQITQADVAADTSTADASFGVLLMFAADSPERRTQIFAALQEVKARHARYRAFAKFSVEGLEYSGALRAYASLEKLLRAKLGGWYAAAPSAPRA